jgi:DNA polymerase elongation subunit (family B)
MKYTNEQIEGFLQGIDPQKYIVAIESDYLTPTVTLVINEPNQPKRLETHTYKPFLWFKEDITKILYGGKRMAIMDACKRFDIRITKLKTSNDDGYSPDRMENGFKFLATCKRSYKDLIYFFKLGGVDVFSKESIKHFVCFSPTEQFLIQTGKRLFKGMDDYDDLHRLQFDLETEGLFANKHAIFQIGVKDNRGIDGVIETLGNTPFERRESERENIDKFFKIIDAVKPDIIAGYNSENFDWPFIFERAERLGMRVNDLAITLNRIYKIKRKKATLKLGGETEHYQQTHMYGYNIIDVSHAVRRAMAINSEIKAWGLKYITQYSEIAKPNRVYVAGDKINSTWRDTENQYAFNEKNGDWYKITERNPLSDGYKVTTGAYIVQRYLIDDLWETEQIDNIFNQASFLIGKILPTDFMRSSTMGTAGQWKLIMAAWSYQNGLAIPETQTKKDFTGGLSRLLEVGFARRVYKFDYAALYPKTQLTHDIFPDLDITGVMKGILTYVVDTRDKFKFLTGTEKKKAKKLENLIKPDPKKMSPKEISEIEARVALMSKEELNDIKTKIAEHKRLANIYDKKQLPLKILANSWFGSYGAPYIFNWGDTDSAEETTCRGRQYLRLMVRHFTEKHGFRGLVLDTDGCNFAAPDNLNEIKYTAKGSHWKTIDDAGKELFGIDAVLAEFNETFMEGRMGLDLDDVCDSTINFARKNYANDIGGKIKLVGNSVKSKKMSVYIEEFLAKGIRMLLDGDGYSFVNYYYDYVDKIYNYQIPLVKMASKSKIKTTVAEYKKKATMKNKAGNPLPKQAHMELVIKDNIDVNLGDVIYYINTGVSKNTGDLKTINRSKMTKKELKLYFEEHGHEPKFETKLQLNCKLINPEIVERDFEAIKELELIKKALAKEDLDEISRLEFNERIEAINKELFTDEYNVSRYLDSFNKKIKPLLVCFDPEIRSKILLTIKKDKKTKIEKLDERIIFTKAECELMSGKPYKETDQDSYEELMKMEDKEIRFWDRVNKVPNNMEESFWNELRVDYIEKMRIAKIEGLIHEKKMLDEILQKLELEDYENIIMKGELPINIFVMCNLNDTGETVNFISRKWDEKICVYEDLFKYEKIAIKRHNFYKENELLNKEDKYQTWLDHLALNTVMKSDVDFIELDVTPVENEKVVGILKEKLEIPKIEESFKKKRVMSESDEDDEDELEEDENGNPIRKDEDLKLDDEIDDTYAQKPDDYVTLEEENKEPKEDDGWLF